MPDETLTPPAPPAEEPRLPLSAWFIEARVPLARGRHLLQIHKLTPDDIVTRTQLDELLDATKKARI